MGNKEMGKKLHLVKNIKATRINASCYTRPFEKVWVFYTKHYPIKLWSIDMHVILASSSLSSLLDGLLK